MQVCPLSSLFYALLTRASDRLVLAYLQGFGLTETSPTTHLTPIGAPKETYGSIGLLCSTVEVRLVDEDDNDVPEGERGELWCVLFVAISVGHGSLSIPLPIQGPRRQRHEGLLAQHQGHAGLNHPGPVVQDGRCRFDQEWILLVSTAGPLITILDRLWLTGMSLDSLDSLASSTARRNSSSTRVSRSLPPSSRVSSSPTLASTMSESSASRTTTGGRRSLGHTSSPPVERNSPHLRARSSRRRSRSGSQARCRTTSSFVVESSSSE